MQLLSTVIPIEQIMLVTFKINHALTKPGEKAFIVGKSVKLGNWIVSQISFSIGFNYFLMSPPSSREAKFRIPDNSINFEIPLSYLFLIPLSPMILIIFWSLLEWERPSAKDHPSIVSCLDLNSGGWCEIVWGIRSNKIQIHHHEWGKLPSIFNKDYNPFPRHYRPNTHFGKMVMTIAQSTYPRISHPCIKVITWS